MSTQLRQAIALAGPEGVDSTKTTLGLVAHDADDLGAGNAAKVYRALADDLGAPSVTYRPELVAVTREVDKRAPGLVDKIVADFVGTAQDDPSNILAFALARELGAAAALGRGTTPFSIAASFEFPYSDDAA